MKTALARVETQVPEEDRIARTEITVDGIRRDVDEIKVDVKTLTIGLNDSIATNAREFGALRTELAEHKADVEKGFGNLRTMIADQRAENEKRFGALQTDSEKNFGAVRVEIERVRTSIESAKLWLILTGIGTFISILGTVLSFLRNVKVT